MSLKEIRKRKGITQRQIAQKMAMEQTTYSKKENGKSPITDEEYIKLADILETSIEEIKRDNQTSPKNEYCTFNDNFEKQLDFLIFDFLF
ncbi:MAG: helix-turn-helix transcriptional regulator [Flavobacteriia bacterium]|nr:helix-turn-helix transcriptional regulator [Flavobacteriia bacterium]